MHNPSTSDGEWVVELTREQLAEHGVATLAEVFAALPPEIGIDIDVKTTLEDAPLPDERTTYGLLVELLRSESVRRPLFVSSFDAAALIHLRGHTDVPLGLITWHRYPLRVAVSTAAHLGLDAVVLHWESFGPNATEPGPVHRPLEESIAAAHAAGLEVVAWCPDVSQAEPLVAAGVDALVVNDVQESLAAGAASAPPPPAPAEQ
jgi:glycerophosphoryl diester phosphodiesterase